MSQAMNRLYNDLAWIWPLWEDLEDYRNESERFAELIKLHTKIKAATILDMGCGGGKNAYYLKKHFQLTGIDISEPMLKNARELNPDCEFLTGDMRNLDLKRQYDSVFINDSITCMTTPEDLLSAFQTAYKHLKPGGVCITYPDEHKGNFQQNETCIWKSSKKDLELVIIQNNYDPDPDDDTFEAVIIFIIRKNGKLTVEKDLHICGIFTLDVWKNLLKKAGFKVIETDLDGVMPVFACIKPIKQ